MGYTYKHTVSRHRGIGDSPDATPRRQGCTTYPRMLFVKVRRGSAALERFRMAKNANGIPHLLSS
jgi:hypothetical protein